MAVVTLEATVENGQIRLPSGVRLPDHTKVYVVVPDLAVPNVEVAPIGRIVTPRLARPEQARDFAMEVNETDRDAGM